MIKRGDKLHHIQLATDGSVTITEHEVIHAHDDGKNVSVMWWSVLWNGAQETRFQLHRAGVFRREAHGMETLLYTDGKRVALRKEIDRIENLALNAYMQSQNLYKYATLLSNIEADIAESERRQNARRSE